MALMKAVFDPNILIDYLNGRAQATVEFSKYDAQAISIITWTEVMAGVSSAEEDVVRRFLDRFECLSVSPAIAERAVSIRSEPAFVCRMHISGPRLCVKALY